MITQKTTFLLFLFCLFALYPFALVAQVQVSKEPRHKKVIENSYIRLLDVRLKPGDTTEFHVHSTPSVFVQLTNTLVCSQLKDKPWMKDHNIEGQVIFKDFSKDSIIHRVSNCDSGPFHVMDMEILAPFESRFLFHELPFSIILENDRVIAYRLNASSFEQLINSAHGPMLALLVKGHELMYMDIVSKKTITLKEGKYLYIPPGNTYQFGSAEDTGPEVNLVLIEIK